MTREDIGRIATEYLNDTESEFEMQDVIELADKALMFEKAIEDIKAEIELARKQGFQRNRKIYDECISIIDKHIGDIHE